MRKTIGFLAVCFTVSAFAAEPFDDKFRQLDESCPRRTPTAPLPARLAPPTGSSARTTRSAPRWTKQSAPSAAARQIHYHNNSPDTLSYLWVQLDQNIYKKDSDARMMLTQPSREAWAKPRNPEDGYKFEGMRGILAGREFDGGFKIKTVSAGGQPLKYTINRTMMRIDLPTPLKPGQSYAFNIDWSYNINEQLVLGGRSGYRAL
jgi:hypothetical protein